jgi:hypothetical protein
VRLRSADDSPRPLRFVIFCESIVSDWDNPAATSTRALARALQTDGHDVVVYEERLNRPVRALLKARGSSALRSFATKYADIHYRTYVLPSGTERMVWIVQQMATADAVIVQSGAPPSLIETLGKLDVSRLVRIAWDAGENPTDQQWADETMVASLAPRRTGKTLFGPMVEPANDRTDSARHGVAIVAYGDEELARKVRSTSELFDLDYLSAGSVVLDGWPFVSEVDLPARYARAKAAVVIGAGEDPWSAARRFLAIASGCPVVTVDTHGQRKAQTTLWRSATIDGLSLAVEELIGGDQVQLPREFNSEFAVTKLSDIVRSTLWNRLSTL